MAKKCSGLPVREPNRPYGQLNGGTVRHQTDVKVEILCIEIEVRLAQVPAGSIEDQASVANTQLDGSTHRISRRDVVLETRKVNGPAVLLDVNVRGNGVGRVWVGIRTVVSIEPKMGSRISDVAGLSIRHQLRFKVQQLQLSDVGNHPSLVNLP